MSNKAIVFYTGELLEVQENSLREAHGVENLIFVPIETVDDLDTKILETTEQPFTVYNYLTDPDLIIAVCDKLSNLTAETGFLPEYFIWVDGCEEKSQRTELTAQVRSPEVLHIDASDMSIPPSISRIKDNVEKFAEMQKRKDVKARMVDYDPEAERPDPYLSYGEAIEMCKKGIDVASVNWTADEFLTLTSAQIVPASQFWSPSNRLAAEAKPEKSLIVDNYFLRTNKYSTVPHQVCFADMFDEWVVASDRVKVKSVTVDTDDGLSKLTLHYALDTFTTPDFELAPFWIVYDVLAKLPQRVTVISDDHKSALPHIVGSMKEAHEHRQQIVEESYQFGEDGIDDNMYPHRGVEFVCSIGLNDILKSIESGEFKDVILDNDSFKTDFHLDKIKEALQKANANWVTVSVKEQLFGITE